MRKVFSVRRNKYKKVCDFLKTLTWRSWGAPPRGPGVGPRRLSHSHKHTPKNMQGDHTNSHTHSTERAHASHNSHAKNTDGNRVVSVRNEGGVQHERQNNRQHGYRVCSVHHKYTYNDNAPRQLVRPHNCKPQPTGFECRL